MKEVSEVLRSFPPPRYKPKVNRKTERGGLLNFFSIEVERPINIIAVRLAHYSKDQLYGLQSAFNDRLTNPCFNCKQNGMTGKCEHSRDTALKYFWWITKTK